ncbi:hypothetical protein DMENIID0001_149410 [Sergentomyia squamirostris]
MSISFSCNLSSRDIGAIANIKSLHLRFFQRNFLQIERYPPNNCEYSWRNPPSDISDAFTKSAAQVEPPLTYRGAFTRTSGAKNEKRKLSRGKVASFVTSSFFTCRPTFDTDTIYTRRQDEGMGIREWGSGNGDQGMGIREWGSGNGDQGGGEGKQNGAFA